MKRKTAPKAATIGDLIEVPPIRSVVQLVDVERADLRDELVETFVWTAEVRELFERLFHALARPHGLGAFLKGHYGSGKSHCLAFLHELLGGNPRAWERLPDDLGETTLPRAGWVQVTVPLFAYSAEHTLESIVMRALEEQVPDAPILAEGTRLLENFKTYVYPQHEAELADWKGLAPAAALRRAREFLASLPDNPLQIPFDRRQAFATLQAALGERRIVLLLDELSEFLRSKANDAAALREDIRFLQFVGEWSDKMGLWVVATLQHSLEELGYLEETTHLRLRERYPLRFTLSSRHVSDLVGGRLIRHRPGSEAALQQLWQDLDRLYPGLIGESEFLRTYPLHPLTLQLLESLIGLFSRHRGVVDFVHTQIAGDPLRGQTGILHEPSDRLLTAESLFDHFRERLSEQSELAPYEASVWAYYEQELPRLFATERDRQLAGAVVKLLILAAISPVGFETSAERLSLLLARRLSRIDPHSNLLYLRENILLPLVERGAFIVRRGDRYVVDLQASLNQVLGQRVRERLRNMRPDWNAALALVNRPQLPLADLVGRAPQPARVRWRNGQRDGMWGLLGEADAAKLTSWATLLETGKEDWALVLLSPAIDASPLIAAMRSQTNLVLWRPAAPEPEMLELLLQWQAHQAVLEQDRNLRPRLESIVGQMRQRLDQWVFGLYSRGELHWGEQRGTPALHESRAERLLLASVAAALEARFPQFKAIAPRLEALTPANLDRLWQEWIEPGTAFAGEHLDPLVEGVAVPLGLAEREGDLWRLKLPVDGPVPSFLARLQPETRYDLHELRRQLQKSPWGVLPAQWMLILAALVQLGKLQLYAHGRAFPLTSIQDLARGKADQLALQPLRSLPALEDLERLRFLFGEDSLVPLHPQRVRELWRVAREQLSELHTLASAVRVELSRTPSDPLVPATALETECREIEHVLSRIGQPHSAAQALGQLVVEEVARLESSGPRLRPWLDFLQRFGSSLAGTRRRCERVGLTPPDALGPRPAEAWGELLDALRAEEEQFASAYAAEHDAHYSAPVFSERRDGLQSVEWKTLLALSRVLGFQSQPSLGALRQSWEGLPQPCRREPGLQCACGFVPGQPVPQAPDWQADVRRALSTGSRKLLRAEQELGAYTNGLRRLEREREVQRLERTLQALEQLETPSPSACAAVLELLDSATQDHLSRALTGQTLVVERDLRTLAEWLQEQRLPIGELRARFEEWLQGSGIAPDAWIHVTAEAGAAQENGGWLRLWLEQHQLGAPPAWRRRFDLQAEVVDEVFPEDELWPLLWEAAATLEPAAAAQVEKLSERLSLHFCQQALRSSLPEHWTVPALSWPHLAVYRQLAELSRGAQWASLARGWRDLQKICYLDADEELVPSDLRAQISAALEQRLAGTAPEPCLPLAEAPARVAAALNAETPWIVLVLDGLRWDLWDLLRPLVLQRLGAPAAEWIAAAEIPTVTRQAREAWLGGPEEIPPGYDGLFCGRPLKLVKGADNKRHRPQVLEQLLQPAPVTMLHFNFIDKRRHTSELELWPLYREILAECEVRLLPWLERIPRLAQVMLLADHGFRDPGASPSAHGGGHWQERYVPAVGWRR